MCELSLANCLTCAFFRTFWWDLGLPRRWPTTYLTGFGTTLQSTILIPVRQLLTSVRLSTFSKWCQWHQKMFLCKRMSFLWVETVLHFCGVIRVIAKWLFPPPSITVWWNLLCRCNFCSNSHVSEFPECLQQYVEQDLGWDQQVDPPWHVSQLSSCCGGPGEKYESEQERQIQQSKPGPEVLLQRWL